jgi:septal ring factor EnvC (AmiA/AmiB activator)
LIIALDGTALAKITEDENLISNLYETIAKLEAQNSEIAKRNKALTDVLEKKKKQIASLERQVNDSKRRDGSRKPSAKERPKSAPQIDIVAARTARVEPTSDHEQENHTENATNNQLLDLVKTYKNRCLHSLPYTINCS